MFFTLRTSHLFQQYYLALTKSVQKSRFSRIVKNSREFSLLDLEAFWFHYSLLEKEWNHFFSLCTSRKRVKAFFSLCTSRTSKTHSRWSLGRPLGSDHEQMWKLSVFFSLLNPVSKNNISFTWCVKKRPQCNGDACWFNHPYIENISSNINQIDNFSILQFRLHSQVFAENVAIYAFFLGKIIRLRILLV